MLPKRGEATRQWGDFQTPPALAREICQYLRAMGCRPDLIVEPTCGEGNFVRAAAEVFPECRQIYGLEIQESYVLGSGPFPGNVSVNQGDIFTHKFPDWVTGNSPDELLILGNPPWVTNAELSTLDSMNLPVKANFRGHSGLDALTGKSNFDISEAIIFKLLETFGHRKGYLAVLCKNAVIRNVLQDLPRSGLQVADIRAVSIDAKVHFDASVDASLLVLRLGASHAEPVCRVFTSTSAAQESHLFGWAGDRFVSDVNSYERWSAIDGACPLVWRQGLKHDCSPVMELVPVAGGYRNRMGDTVDLEAASVFPYLKSSDLKGFSLGGARFQVPVTQRKIGEDTRWITERYPRLWAYLERHRALFEGRKSSIYRGKPKYSIFGIGDYSFAPYKVAISGMYKTGMFTLLEPVDGKPAMLDDTCYFLGFDSYPDALLVCGALNSEMVRNFLRSVVFLDAKRPYTKDLLMRIDLGAAFKRLTYSDIAGVWARFGYEPTSACTEDHFHALTQRLARSGRRG